MPITLVSRSFRPSAYVVPGLATPDRTESAEAVARMLAGAEPDQIIDRVAQTYEVNVEDLHKKTRKGEVVQARQVAQFLMVKVCKMSFAKAAKAVGGQDHATAMHSCRTVKNRYDTEKEYRKQFLKLIFI